MTAAQVSSTLESFEPGSNPIRVIREAKGLSIRAAANKIGCHHQALYMNESGAYAAVLPVVLNWLVENSDYSRVVIELAYWSFIESQREAAKMKYGFATADISDLGKPGDNPVQKFREHFGLTRSKFCKTVCVSASLMYTVENSGARHVAASIPSSLLTVYRDLAISDIVITEMIERYKDWYDGLG